MNIVCTSKPCDGLLYYSYEYCCCGWVHRQCDRGWCEAYRGVV